MQKGDEGDCMYIIYQGEVNIYVGESSKVTVTLCESQVFGERAMVTDELRMATVVVKSPKIVALSLLKKDYKDILYVSEHLIMLTFTPTAYSSPLEITKTDLPSEPALLQRVELHSLDRAELEVQ